ncbi:MAG: 4-hydroxy-2-oxovalerate aldolase, partial [Gammaproteobacteria bacterium]
TCVYVTDSAGYMLPDDVKERVSLLRENLPAEVELGFHAHNNLSVSVANSLAAVEAGANRIDGSAAGLGAGAGNTPLEAFAAVTERCGIETGVDLFKLMDVAEDIVKPIMDQPVRVDRDALSLGYAGTYSTFLLHAQRFSKLHNIPVRDLLVECGRRRTVAGQEDMIESIALDMLKERETA